MKIPSLVLMYKVKVLLYFEDKENTQDGHAHIQLHPEPMSWSEAQEYLFELETKYKSHDILAVTIQSTNPDDVFDTQEENGLYM